VILLVLLLPSPVTGQWLAHDRPGVSISASIGTVSLAGAEDSSPPAGRASVWSMRVATPITSVVSLEAEYTRSGAVDGSSARVANPVFRERRRDHIAAVYARVGLWRKAAFAVYPIAGIAVVKPTRQLSGATFDVATGAWKEQPLSDAGYPAYPHTLAFSWGADAEIGGRSFAVVPSIRAHEHLSDVSPWIAARIMRTVYGSVGLRYRF
jgi:hypothetical protein